MRRAAVLLLLLLAGCGYRFSGGSLPGGVERLYLPLAVNQTAEPLLENQLAAPVTAVLGRQKGVVLVESPAKAQAKLLATILTYEVKPLSYDSNDRISEFQSRLLVHFELRQVSDDRLLWQSELQRLESYRAALDKNLQEDNEALAIERLLRNLADDLIYQLVSGF